MKHPRDISPTRHATRAFTLTEMLVSVAVLGVMIMAFSQIMSQTNKLVTGTQISIRANAAAAAISDIIRRDLQQTHKDGFLYIKSSGEASGDVLIATTAGIQNSLTSDIMALGAATHYGLADNLANTEEKVLFRQCWLLPGAGETSNNDDVWNSGGQNLDASEFTGKSAGDISAQCATLDVPPTLKVPPTNEDELSMMWAVLARRVTDLRISYAQASGGAITWTAATTAGKTWTHEDPDNWPVLVRFSFKLDDGSFVRAGLDGANVYEVVCPVGQ